jgi:hypothetical protein
MASWLLAAASRATEVWNDWGLRIIVASSVAAHVALVALARTRRHHKSFLGKLLLWPAYQAAGLAAFALGKLALKDTSSLSPCSRDQELIAFWAPFLLLQLALPDNISAYDLEDNKFSWRQFVKLLGHVLGVTHVLFQLYFCHNSGNLLPASIIMFFSGFAKYAETAYALWKGDLGNIRPGGSSNETAPPKVKKEEEEDDYEEALELAQKLFDDIRSFMVDDSSAVVEDDDDDATSISEIIFSLGSSSTRKVVEMEASLMYDFIYTKVNAIHSLVGYVVRLLSPVASATAASLFWCFPKGNLKTPDIVITYILLGVTFMLDVLWLVVALSSTWAYAFLEARPGGWLYHKVLCDGWWRWFRCIVLSLDPTNRLLARERRWSGRIGRYNLLYECTRARDSCLWSWILDKIGWEDSSYLTQLPSEVMEMLFRRTRERLPVRRHHDSSDPEELPYTMKDITTLWGQAAVKRRRPHVFDEDDQPFFGREFQEDILAWHIGTTIFLACADQQLIHQDDHGEYAEAIEVLSEYLMYLVALRRDMLPGLVLRTLFEVTRDALGELWVDREEKCYSSCPRARKQKMAEILHKKKAENEKLYWDRGNEKRRLISDGAALGIMLLEKVERTPGIMRELLKLVFDVWVDKLLYAGIRCSKESHAKQLSRGGGFTTIVWITTGHAGTFRVGDKTTTPPTPPPTPPRPDCCRPPDCCLPSPDCCPPPPPCCPPPVPPTCWPPTDASHWPPFPPPSWPPTHGHPPLPAPKEEAQPAKQPVKARGRFATLYPPS